MAPLPAALNTPPRITTGQLCPMPHNAHKVKTKKRLHQTQPSSLGSYVHVRLGPMRMQAGPSRGGDSLPLPVGEGGRGAAQRLPAVLRSQGAREREGEGGSPPTGKRGRMLGTAAIVTAREGQRRRVNGGERTEGGRLEPGERWGRVGTD